MSTLSSSISAVFEGYKIVTVSPDHGGLPSRQSRAKTQERLSREKGAAR